jgi:hypothetical protein
MYARASARTKSIRSLVIGDASSGDTLRMSLRSLVVEGDHFEVDAVAVA